MSSWQPPYPALLPTRRHLSGSVANQPVVGLAFKWIQSRLAFVANLPMELPTGPVGLISGQCGLRGSGVVVTVSPVASLPVQVPCGKCLRA